MRTKLLSHLINDPQRLAALAKLNLGTEPEEVFDRLCRFASKLLKAPISLVSLVDSDRQFFKSAVGLDGWAGEQRWTTLDYSFCKHVVGSRAPFVVENAYEHPLVSQNLGLLELNAVAYAGIPLTLSTGETLGSFCVIDNVPRTWVDEDLEILRALAESVITELELRSELIRHKETSEHLSESLGALQLAHTKVQELEGLKTDMIRIAAHDLANPLNSMRGVLDLLLEEPEKLDAQQLELLDILDTSTERMTSIVRDILSLQRAEAMVANELNEVFDLGSVVMQAYEHNQICARDHEQEFLLNLEDLPLLVQGDRSLIHEAVVNLISNAIKYTPRDGKIEVRLNANGNQALFEVVDNGCGIPEHMQKKLFEPFYRASTAETLDISGNGLGLNLVKRIVERHHGTIIFNSVYKQGSRFGFALPCASEEAIVSPA